MSRDKLTRRFNLIDGQMVDTDAAGEYVYADAFDALQDTLIRTEKQLIKLQMKDQRLALAEAYDAVSRDLAWRAQEFGRIADFCGNESFRICEQKVADDASVGRAADQGETP